MPETLRKYSDHHIEEDCSDTSGFHENELFFGCNFKNLNGLTLKDCVLSKSAFETDRIHEALNFTLTLNCSSFKGVEYSPLLFDLLLVMMISTRGNDEKRAKLIEVIGLEKYKAIAKVLDRVE